MTNKTAAQMSLKCRVFKKFVDDCSLGVGSQFLAIKGGTTYASTTGISSAVSTISKNPVLVDALDILVML